MSIFKERERCCEATFLDVEPYWHAYTSGKDTPLLFSLEEDFVFVMNVISQAAALFPEVRIITFEVMNNHFHFVVSADEETVLTFWGFVRKRLSDLQKQFRNQVAEMSRKSVPLSLPGNVKAELMAAYQDCLNETKRMQKEMLTDYIQALRKHTEKFQADLSNSKGVWLSRKVFWWSAGIAYILSLLGFCIIIWNLVH